MEIRVLF